MTDVLLLMRRGHHDQPQKTRVPILRLAKVGIRMEVRNVPDDPATLIERHRPRILLNGMLCIAPDRVAELATRFPTTQFVAVNHSGLSHCLSASGLLTKHLEFVRLARDLQNCWLASPDARNFPAAYAHSRIITLPNCCMELRPIPDARPVPDVLTVSLICRRDVIKNIPDSIAAMAIANHQRRFRLLLGVGGETATLLDLATSLGVEAESIGQLPWKHYVQTLQDRVDVGLQCSYSETFNFVAWEHLARGVPVVGSPAISFLPESMTANPADPLSIASRLIAVADALRRDPAAVRSKSRRIARLVGDENNAAFVAAIQAVLSKGSQQP